MLALASAFMGSLEADYRSARQLWRREREKCKLFGETGVEGLESKNGTKIKQSRNSPREAGP